MTQRFESTFTAEFIVSQASGKRSFKAANVVVTEATDAGTLLAFDAATGDYSPMALDGTPAGILTTPATVENPNQTVFVRDGEVLVSSLIHPEGATAEQIATANTALEDLNIYVRTNGIVVT